MTITYQPTQSDLIHAARTWEGQHWKASRYVVAAILISCGIFLLISSGLWWGALFVLVGLLETFNLLPSAIIKAIIEYRTNPKFSEEYQLTLSAENLHFRTTTIDSTLKWTIYTSFLETSKAFILVYGKRMYTIIPKRALDNETKIHELRELLGSVIGTPVKG
jgi:hypothetical protein